MAPATCFYRQGKITFLNRRFYDIFTAPLTGGDIYYFGVCKGDTISRLAIADVTGHGEAVSEISQYVYDSLKAHM
jgi:serine phosphatase RsbU (regulator of sigma subunit)